MLNQVLEKLVGAVRVIISRTEQTSHCMIEAQSLWNTDRANLKDYDAGKRVSGTKFADAIKEIILAGVNRCTTQ